MRDWWKAQQNMDSAGGDVGHYTSIKPYYPPPIPYPPAEPSVPEWRYRMLKRALISLCQAVFATIPEMALDREGELFQAYKNALTAMKEDEDRGPFEEAQQYQAKLAKLSAMQMAAVQNLINPTYVVAKGDTNESAT